MADRFVWLASYPKSGSTWTRALLTALTLPEGEALDINNLVGVGGASHEEFAEDVTGLNWNELPMKERRSLMPEVTEAIIDECKDLSFCKTHDAYAMSPDGRPIFASGPHVCAVYVARDPRDVALSYAHHSGQSVERIVKSMANAKARTVRDGGQTVELLGTWQDHVLGWLDQRAIPVHLVRYEDLGARPAETLSAIAGFVGLDVDGDAVTRAVEMAAFANLKTQEAASGFRERSSRAEIFFRQGKAGGWRESLPGNLAEAIAARHAEAMDRLGYTR